MKIKKYTLMKLELELKAAKFKVAIKLNPQIWHKVTS